MKGAMKALLVYSLFSAGILSICAAQTIDGPPNPDSVSLEDLLASLGKQYDCYFTVEGGWRNHEAINAVARRAVTPPQKASTLAEAIDELAKGAPGLRFEIDKRQNRIVHVIDRRLDGQTGYGLDTVIPTFVFSGQTMELVSELRKSGVPIGNENTFAVGQRITFDASTNANVNARDYTVREILSDFIPLDGYNRVIWTASTRISPRSDSMIHYRGRIG